jgi:mono/diheme cytochrome c family protein
MRHLRLFAPVAAVSVLLSATALGEVDSKTQRLWKAQCGACHGAAGKGDTEKGKEMKVTDMSTAAFQGKSDDALKKAITDGVKGPAGNMDPFKDLTPEQVTALVGMMRTFKK